MKLDLLKVNPDNPQLFNDLSKLMNSIKEFPKMMKLRPLVYDPKTMYVLGGNKRLISLQRLGFKEIPDDWAIPADKLTKAEKKRFVIADNVGFGEWDEERLEEQYSLDDLEAWGVEMEEKIEEEDEEFGKQPEIEFSEFLDEESNFVVLYFKNRIDWLQAETHFDLKTVSAKRSNGKPWSSGVGRVIDGSKYLKDLNNGQ